MSPEVSTYIHLKDQVHQDLMKQLLQQINERDHKLMLLNADLANCRREKEKQKRMKLILIGTILVYIIIIL